MSNLLCGGFSKFSHIDASHQYMNPSAASSMSYSIKVTHPEYMVQKLHNVKTSLKKDEIKGIIEEHCDYVSVSLDSLGYVEPGHGEKRKQSGYITDADTAVYKAHQGIKKILSLYSRG